MSCQNDCKEEFKEIFRRLNECEKDIRTCQNNKDYFERYFIEFKNLFLKHEESNTNQLEKFLIRIENLEGNHNKLFGVFLFFQIVILPIVFIIISKYF
ncbi:MAG: hypothetical protein RBT49_17530 [Bacteroidales bacterium]|jgi:hypothetical protein|nr:hypothetical protein [Bacteroidales bacterium]